MNVDKELEGLASLMHFQGSLGMGWYARMKNAPDFAFGHTPSEAIDSAREARFIRNAEAIAIKQARRRVVLEEEPKPRRRASLFDE